MECHVRVLEAASVDIVACQNMCESDSNPGFFLITISLVLAFHMRLKTLAFIVENVLRLGKFLGSKC